MKHGHKIQVLWPFYMPQKGCFQSYSRGVFKFDQLSVSFSTSG